MNFVPPLHIAASGVVVSELDITAWTQLVGRRRVIPHSKSEVEPADGTTVLAVYGFHGEHPGCAEPQLQFNRPGKRSHHDNRPAAWVVRWLFGFLMGMIEQGAAARGTDAANGRKVIAKKWLIVEVDNMAGARGGWRAAKRVAGLG